MFRDLAEGVGYAFAYGGVGIVLMVLGFVLVDVLTPGNLGRQIWIERNRNAALVLSSALLGVGMIVTTAIATTYDEFGKGLASTALFGVSGLILMAIAFLVIDLVTPGRLGATVVEREPHPCVWVTASSQIAIAAIVSACIA
ncbi:DUF350 domain-containing protein [Embleya sp. NBC_00896]|uniref:DUF350 domain-containing protein n=1 Tax=Embleya sp. NBC_00896 TaxID=2975961 RepID=UPI003870D16D|nr:DUF350 domain-containing protein [Embleya sp. NBC_00896]